MGFKRPVIQPVFTGELEGFQITARRPNIDQVMTLSATKDLDMDDRERTNKTIMALCETLAELIVNWNLTDDDDKPEPVTAGVLYTLDWEMLVEIASSMVSTTKPDEELGKGSLAGVPSVEESLPMELLSESQAS